MASTFSGGIGISAIATYEPPWVLGNDWFGGTLARKFVHHTGIESRPVSLEDDEVTLAIRATKNLQRETGCDLQDCAAVVFASPSFVPIPVARRHLDERRVRQELIRRAARLFARRLRIPDCPVAGLNWFCSGYSKALAVASRRIFRKLTLGQDQFILVVNASRISRITDYGCTQTGPLFGDLATVTLLARPDSQKYPVHFDLLYAAAEKQPAERAFFDFHLRENVPLPTIDGGRIQAPQRLVFSLDGMGIADAAPRAMAGALVKGLDATGLSAGEVQFVIPHQAGTGIVRLTGMKLEQSGIGGELINGLTKNVGNVSSCSIPYALKQTWGRLHGLIACPTAAVGDPGQPEVSQGCVLLRSTALHNRRATQAA